MKNVDELKGGEAVVSNISLSRATFNQLNETIEQLKEATGHKINRSKTVATLVSLFLNAIEHLDCQNIYDDETYKKELLQAIKKLS